MLNEADTRAKLINLKLQPGLPEPLQGQGQPCEIVPLALFCRAREIIELLVDKYRVWGLEEIARPEVFCVRPLSEYGTFTAIVELIHGPRDLRKVVDDLQVRLYGIA
jgi:hypothetical protein